MYIYIDIELGKNYVTYFYRDPSRMVTVPFGHDRFFVIVTSRMDIIHDVTKWAVHL